MIFLLLLSWTIPFDKISPKILRCSIFSSVHFSFDVTKSIPINAVVPPASFNGTANTDLWSASKIISYVSNYAAIYTIRLISASTVAGRLIGLTPGVDYPTGWVLSADDAALVITHNLDRLHSSVKVISINGVTSNGVELQGNLAYSSVTNVYGTGYNAIRLDALATITTELYIKILV